VRRVGIMGLRCIRVKRDLITRQKRPTVWGKDSHYHGHSGAERCARVSKETYSGSKRDLLTCAYLSGVGHPGDGHTSG
jgi:hypothetical protein